MKSDRSAMPILFASLVIVMLGFGIAIPLMPFYITHFKASGSVLGLMISLYSFMQFFFAPLWGKLSDRYGRKPVILIGMIGAALSFGLQGLAQNVVQLIGTRVLAGILSSATLPTAMAYVADTTPLEERSKGVGMMGAGMGLGMVLGPMLGGILTGVKLDLPLAFSRLLQVTQDPSSGQLINLSIPFFVSGIMALLGALFVFFMLPESLSVEKRAQHALEQRQTPKESRLRSLLNSLNSPLGFLFIMAFLLAFALANMESVLSLYGAARFKMGPSDIGFLMGAIGILSVIQQGVVIGPLTHRFGEGRVIQGGLIFGIAGFIIMALASVNWMLVAGALVFNVGNVLLQPSVTALISKKTQSGQGEAMGINNSFQSLGRAIGPLWAGYAFDFYSTLSFWTGALIQTAALVYSLFMLKSEIQLFNQNRGQSAVAIQDR